MSSTERYSIVNQLSNDHYQPPTREEHELHLRTKWAKEDIHNSGVFRHNLKMMFYLSAGAYAFLYPLQRLRLLSYCRPDINFVNPDINYRFSSLMFVIRRESPLRLYRGLIPNLLTFLPPAFVAPFAFDFFDTPDYLYTESVDEAYGYEVMLRHFAATSCVIASQVIIHPIRIAAVKMATDINIKGLNTAYRYKTSLDCLARVVKHNGFQGLFTALPFYVLKSYFIWFLTFGSEQRLKLADESGTWEGHRWTLIFSAFRYELSLILLAWAMNPIESIFARKIHRIPTFKHDKMPKQFPRMWLPTFRGLLSMFRGSMSNILLMALLTLFGRLMHEAYLEAIIPPHLHPNNANLLWEARYAVMRRERDGLSGIKAVFPTHHPVYGSNPHHIIPRLPNAGVGERWRLGGTNNSRYD